MTPNSRSYLNRWLQPDVIVPDPYNSLDLDRYSYVRNNPTRYTDPTGHFTEEQLEEWFGSDWKNVISQNYSAEVVTILMSKDTKLGDMVTFVRDGKTFGAAFCLDEKGGLTMWDLGSKSQVSYDSVLKNDITGFYKQEAPGLFKLQTNYSDSKLPSEYRLGWNWSGGHGKHVEQSTVHSQPTPFEYACFAVGTAALVEGFGPIGAASYALGVTPLVFRGEIIYQIQSYQSTYPGMPAPLAGPNEPMGTPVPPTSLNP